MIEGTKKMENCIDKTSAEDVEMSRCSFALLESAALRAGQNAVKLRELFWLLNVHPQLPGFVRVCKHLLEILSFQAELPQLEVSRISLESWEVLLHWIVEHGVSLGQEIFPGNEKDARRFLWASPRNPLIKANIKRYGLHGALWASHQDKQQQKPFRLLQRTVLIAHVAVMDHTISIGDLIAGKEPFPGYFEGLYRPTLELRHFASGNAEWVSLLQRIDFCQDTDGLIGQLAKMADEVSARYEVLPDDDDESDDADRQDSSENAAPAPQRRMSHQENALRTIATFLERGKNPESYQRRSSGYNGTPTGGSNAVDGPGADDEELADGVAVEIRAIEIPSGNFDSGGVATLYAANDWARNLRRSRRAVNAGDHPGDSGPPQRLYLAEDEHGVSIVHAGAIEMANQLLPWSYSNTSASELVETLKHLDRVASEQAPEMLELSALLQTMLWLGASLEHAVELFAIVGIVAAADVRLAIMHPLLLGQGEADEGRWLIKALTVDYQPENLPPVEAARPIAKYIGLPDPVGGTQPVLRYLRYLRDVGQYPQPNREAATQEPFRIFKRDLDYYRLRLHEVLQATDRTGRITTSMISGLLFQTVEELTGGDVVVAALITQTDHYLASVRRHYATPEVHDLQSKYVQAVRAIDTELKRCGLNRQNTGEVRFERSDLAVGSMLCPTMSTVRKAVSRMRSELEGFAPHLWTVPDAEFGKLHNLYTLYCVLACGFVMGVRGVSNPYPHSSQINWELGFAVVTDKDSGSGYKSRLVWLPRIILEMMQQYEDYLASISESFGLRAATRELPCYFLNADLQQKTVRPRTMAPLLQEYLPFPANAGRHFVYNALRERGVSAEIVDSLMGHWWCGEEPWGPFSTLRLANMRKELDVALPSLLSELGFGPIALRLPGGKRR